MCPLQAGVHRLVQMQTRLRNQLHAVALNEGVRLKKCLWRPKGRAQLESLNHAEQVLPTSARPGYQGWGGPDS
jgi:hypothetical protein